MLDFKRLLKEVPKETILEFPIFEQYIMPYGLFTPDPVEHALFYYYLNARYTYEKYILNTPIIMEDEIDPSYNFHGLFTSVAALYGVEPEKMVNAWTVIDKQCDILKTPKLPNEYRYRFTDSLKKLIH